MFSANILKPFLKAFGIAGVLAFSFWLSSLYLRGEQTQAPLNLVEENPVLPGWERELWLERDTVVIHWNFTKQNLTMMITARTRGYVAVGFTHSPGMEHSDIVLGWVKDGKAFIKDLYGVENGRPFEDHHSDYHLLFGHENETHTWICFRRNLDTCDEHDLEITKSTFDIMWALNDEDPVDARVESIMYHANRRGVAKATLLFITFPQAPMTPDIESFDVVAPNITVKRKTKPFYWYCHVFKMPKFKTPRQIIGYEAIINQWNKKYVHHRLLYYCRSRYIPKTINTNTGFECMRSSDPRQMFANIICKKMIAGTAVEDIGQSYPPDMGIQFGSSEDQVEYMLLEIHYNLQDHTEAFVDNSGIRLFLTNRPRPKSFGSFLLMQRHYQIIPPRAMDFPNIFLCSAKCTQTLFPKEGIHILGLFFHAHALATKMVLNHFRNGKLLNQITDEYFSFKFQNERYLKEKIHVLPNDTIVLQCIYDSTNRTRSTATGFDSNDEMCLVVLYIYPDLPNSICWSNVIGNELHNIFPNVVPVVTQGSSPVPFLLQLLHAFAFKHFADTHDWTTEETNALRTAIVSGQHVSQCHFDDFINNIEEIVRLPNISESQSSCRNSNKNI